MERELEDVQRMHWGKLYVKELLFKGVMLLLGIVLGVALGVFLGVSKPWQKEVAEALPTPEPLLPIEEETVTLTVSNVEELLKPASDLISQKYYYTDTGTYESTLEAFGQKIPLTTDKVVFTYDGVISVGIDLSMVIYEVNNESKTITLTLPEVKVFSNEIDPASFEYPHITDSVFNNTEMGDYTDMIATLKVEKEAEILNNVEFMTSARKNAEQILSEFLTASTLTQDYTVMIK